MDATQELLQLNAIKTLKARYFLYLDTKQWDDWLALFTDDAELAWDSSVSTRGGDGQTASFSGRASIRENVILGILDPATTVHQGHTPVLELVSDTEASGIWAMEDIVYGGTSGSVVHGWGHYHETYLKDDGEWKISSLHLTRLLLETTNL